MKPLTLEETGIKTDDNEMCIKGIDELPIFSWNTKTKEFYVLGHKFDGINSIEDFINYIHNLDKENKSLQSQLKSKEEENQELKLELSGYRQAILEDKDMLGLKEESEELKKQLTTYKILHRDCKVDNLKNISKIEEMENQQKEFIKYLEDEIKQINPKELDIGELNLRLDDIKFTQYLIYKEILQKYKEIIGDDK